MQTLSAGFGAAVVATRARVPTVAGLCGSHDPRAVPRARALATLSSDARPGGSRNKNKGTAVCGSMFCVHSDATLRMRMRMRVRARACAGRACKHVSTRELLSLHVRVLQPETKVDNAAAVAKTRARVPTP